MKYASRAYTYIFIWQSVAGGERWDGGGLLKSVGFIEILFCFSARCFVEGARKDGVENALVFVVDCLVCKYTSVVFVVLHPTMLLPG